MREKIKNELRLEIKACSENESYARYAVSAFVAQLDPTLEELSDVRTVVSEAVTNSVIHGYRGMLDSSPKIYINVKLYEGRRCVIKIRDRGCGIEDIERAMQPAYTGDPSGERGGMGFVIMKSFTDSLKVRSAPGRGTSVVMVKRLG